MLILVTEVTDGAIPGIIPDIEVHTIMVDGTIPGIITGMIHGIMEVIMDGMIHGIIADGMVIIQVIMAMDGMVTRITMVDGMDVIMEDIMEVVVIMEVIIIIAGHITVMAARVIQ